MKFKKDITFIDLETTGFSPINNEVTEVGVIRLDGETLEVKEEYNELVQIEGFIPLKVQELTGITNELLEREGLPMSEVKASVQELLEDTIVVAHNVPFDFSFLKWQFDIEPEFFYDTLSLSRIIESENKTHKLGDICDRIGYSLDNAHRAIHDVRATIKVFKHLLSQGEDYHKQYINTLHTGGRGLKFTPENTREIITK